MSEGEERGYAVQLAEGGAARAVGLDVQGEVMHLVADRAFPPGRPLAFELLVPDDAALALQGKAAGSKRRDDGRYDVKVKLHTLRRDQRARLAAMAWT